MSASEPSFYITGGTLRHDAPSYVERQADRDLLDGLVRGEFCYVLTSRQMGKSSLMVRTAIKLRDRGAHVIVMDLTAVGQNLTPEQWYDGLVVRMGRQLRLEDELETFWRANGRLGPCQRLFAALHDVVMIRRSGSLAIFVDEIDTVRSLPFPVDEFFAAIRECYNRRSEDGEFNRLTFCLLGVATPSDLIRDTRTTPFNIGQRIELHDFTRAEAATLAQGLKHLGATDRRPSGAPSAESTGASDGTAGQLLTRILFWTNGHPYLTQRFCLAVAEGASIADASGVDRLCEELFLSSRALERDDNLLFVRERLLRSEADITSLLELYLRVRAGRSVADDETSQLVTVLRLAGIVTARDGRLEERNRIYRQVFDRQWVRAHLPEADVRRQKAAFRRGVIRASAIAAVVVAALTVAVLFALNQAAQARKALAWANYSQAKTRRISGTSGQRHESLKALGEARRGFTNETMLRNEVIACLALMDLRQKTNGLPLLKRTDAFELNPDAGVSAAAEPDGSITVRRIEDARLLHTLPGSGAPIEKLRFGPTEPVLLAEYRGGVGNQIAVWNWQTRQKRFGLAHGSNAEAIDFSPDGGRLAVGRPDGWLMVYSATNGDLLEKRELTLNSGAARAPQAVRFSPSGDLLAECSLHDYYVRIWTTGASHPVARLYHTDFVHDLAWHPGGELLATACRDALVYLWTTNETVKPRKLGKLGHEGCVTAVAFNRRGTVLASAGLDETTRLWFPATEEQAVRSFDGEHFDRLRFSGQDKLLVATGNRQTSARVWDVLGAEYVPLRLLAGPAERIKNIDFSPDGRWLAGAIGERAGIWDATSGSEAGRLNFGSANTPAAWFSADSRSLLTPTVDGLFRRALVSRGDASPPRVDWEAAQQINGVTNELRAMSVTPSRRLAAIARHDEVLLVSFDPQNACSLRTIPVEVHYHQLALHPEGTWLAGMIGQSNSIHLWSLAENTGIRSPIILPASEHFTFSPDGRWLAAFWAGEFRFYRVGDWRQPAFAISRTTASGQHSPLAFARDGATIALASSRYAIQLLRLPEDGSGPPMLLASLEGSDRSPLEMLAFSPDGRMLAAVTQSQVVQLWNLALLRDGLAALDLQNGWTNYP